MAIRKRGSIKSKLTKLTPKNIWSCTRCRETASTDAKETGLNISPKCPKCGQAMMLVGLGS